MNFGEVLIAVQEGKRARRAGWNGKGMWIAYSPGCLDLPAEKFWSTANATFARRNGGVATVGGSISMKAADGVIEMGWRPTSRDMFALDWELLREDEL